MTPNIQVLYEYGIDGKPHSSGVIRLLRPFAYPTITTQYHSRKLRTFDRNLPSKWVIVDRFWHPHDVTFGQVESLVKEIHDSGSRLIYALDDNLLDLPRERFSFQEHHFQIVEYLLQKSDGILVTTPFLNQRFSSYQKPTFILRNSLDDRLLLPVANPGYVRNGTLKIGYMGTLTHAHDINMILPALKSAAKRHPNVRFEIIGGIAKPEAAGLLSGLPITWINPSAGQDSYLLFMLWYTSHVKWDIALAPLEDTPFNQAKSDIKLLDYSAIGAASIFSDVEAYRYSVIHRKTGWLAENTSGGWEDALETMISKEDLRAEIARNAYQYLYHERILKVCAPQWVEAIHFFEQGLASFKP